MSHPEEATNLRVTEAERDQIVARLRDACLDGRLTLDEFSDRVEIALAARTREELESATSDLGTSQGRSPNMRTSASQWVVTALGDRKMRGSWQLSRETNILSIIGDCEIDLRNATVHDSVVTIRTFSMLGDVEVVVPEGVDVEFSGGTIIGDQETAFRDVPALPGSPLIRIQAFTLIGDVKVQSRS